MDTKRLVIAVVVSVIVVMGWNYLAVKLGWISPAVIQEPVGSISSEQDNNQSLPSSIDVNRLDSVRQGEHVSIKTPLYEAKIAVNGGILQSLRLHKYLSQAGGTDAFEFFTTEASNYAPLGVLVNGNPTWGSGSWKISEKDVVIDDNSEKRITLEADIDDLYIIRELTFSGLSYLVKERTIVKSKKANNVSIGYTLDTASLSTNEKYNVTKIAWNNNNSVDTEQDTEDLSKGQESLGNIQWVGVMDNYFLAAIAPTDVSSITMRSKYEQGIYRVAIYMPSLMSSMDNPAITSTYYYIGPKVPSLLDVAPNNLNESITYGFFAFLSRPLILFLEFIYSFVHNYGIAIIILTFTIKLLFWPLSQKSFSSMNKMKQLQPKIEEIREKYKDSKEEMNKAIMNLYKTYKVNPMGGCLPLLVQIPVFFALYEALLNSLSLRHASFIEMLPFTDIIWLADLSNKDPLYITPIAMGVSMFLQQLIAPSTGDPVQRKVMLAMPLIFTLFFLNFPAGLVLYWLSSNIISIIQQWLLMRNSKSLEGK